MLYVNTGETFDDLDSFFSTYPDLFDADQQQALRDAWSRSPILTIETRDDGFYSISQRVLPG